MGPFNFDQSTFNLQDAAQALPPLFTSILFYG